MKTYPAEKIRNICLLGHGGDGKTSLTESLLFMTKATDRLGKVADGNTISDYDPEEIKRKISVSASLVPIEFNDHKINVLDAPGYLDFGGERQQALRVAGCAVIVCSAKNGVGVGTELAWKRTAARKIPKMIYISKIDEENADYYKAFDGLREKFGVSVCPIVIPAIVGGKTVGIVDVVKLKAYELKDGVAVEMPIPAEMQAKVDEVREQIKESVAETSEEYMNKFFDGEEFTTDEYVHGINIGLMQGSLTPVFCGSAMTGIGSLALLRGLIDYAPSPFDMPAEIGEDANGELVDIERTEKAPTRILIFKTVSDQYGKVSYFKVMSGKVTDDMTLINARTGEAEKVGHLYFVRGKNRVEAKMVGFGDIGAISKFGDAKTGDTFCAADAVVALGGFDLPKPTYAQAVLSKVKGGEEKIAAGLARLAEEDLTFTAVNNNETHQYIVTGCGDMHIDILCSRLKARFGAEVELEAPRVPYREKIRRKVRVQGKHKKQSGGHGQYGDVWMEFEPGDQEDLVFEEKVVGGAVPKNFFPAVEKGLRECISKGVVAGFPVVYLKATLVDGSYHDVDSSEMAFKMAASLAYKAGLPQANPVLLEPIGTLAVTVPDSYMGDVIGDLNKRRGRVLGMTPAEAGHTTIDAEVPMAEMHTYTIDLRSMTQGRGMFVFEFARYEEAPMNVQEKVVAERAHLLADE